MTKTLKFLAALLVAFPVFVQAQRTYSQAELDQMLAPIALYPDALLSQVLMAATYPREVLEAAEWSRANRGLEGDDAVRAAQNEDWDPSVKSLVAFPQLLARMEEKFDWTRDLGDAFLAQEADVMDTVQQLRRRARAAGNLESGEQLDVQQDSSNITVRVASAQHFYLPYYDPLVVYGSWWWPAYRPVYWSPWPGYARPYRSSIAFWWGSPVSLSVGFFFGNFDWHHRHVRVVHPTAYYYRPPVVVVNRTVVVDRGRWQHDPHHRRRVDYRAPEVRQRFASTQVERRDVQHEERRDARPATRAQAQPRAAERAHREQQLQQQRQQAESARFQQQLQREQAEASRARQLQQADSARFQQQQRQQAEASRAQQRQQAEAARFQQQQRQQAEASRAQQRQQVEAARFQQQQQRQHAEAARAQQQQRQEQRAAMPAAKAPQTPRAEREERREQRHERGQKG